MTLKHKKSTFFFVSMSVVALASHQMQHEHFTNAIKTVEHTNRTITKINTMLRYLYICRETRCMYQDDNTEWIVSYFCRPVGNYTKLHLKQHVLCILFLFIIFFLIFIFISCFIIYFFSLLFNIFFLFLSFTSFCLTCLHRTSHRSFSLHGIFFWPAAYIHSTEKKK